MASPFSNIVRINFIKLLEALDASCFPGIGRCFERRENVTRVTSLSLTESVDYRKRGSHRKQHRTFLYFYSVLGLVAANSKDKEGGNSLYSSFVSQSLSPSLSLSLSPRKTQREWALHERNSKKCGPHETWISKLHRKKETGV